MALAKKGTRRISVGQTEYIYKVSRIKKTSELRSGEKELEETFLKFARYYGLGQVMDAVINIVVQLEDNPSSSLFVKCKTIIVDGFMGFEQVLSIKPSLVAGLITQAMEEGWNPERRGDYRMNVAQCFEKGASPQVLLLPEIEQSTGEYGNVVRICEVNL